MCARDRRSHDQKRKAKLAKRAEKQESTGVTPYSGRTYQSSAWTPHVYATESAIYEGIVQSQRRLTNEQVGKALVQLVLGLRKGLSPIPTEGEPEVPFAEGNEVAFLVWNIRRHWGLLFQERGPVATDDLIGILRTLLNSIEAHAWNTGPRLGYVDFLWKFMHGEPPRLQRGIPGVVLDEE
jgi:hypothetical protein